MQEQEAYAVAAGLAAVLDSNQFVISVRAIGDEHFVTVDIPKTPEDKS